MRAAARRNSNLASALNAQSRLSVGFQQQRSFSDDSVVLSNTSNRLDIKYNGRSSVSGVRATVFGGSGFVGRYVINRLGRIGSQVVVPYRGDGMKTRHLKVMGDLGQIVMLPMDMTDVDSIRQSVEHSNVIINLIGASHETKNYSYDDVHVKVAHRIAKTCAESGNVKRFIHVSAAGADADSSSRFLQSKAHGEEAIKAYFPDATIIRPCDIFGHEDKFLNRSADAMRFLPAVPVLNDQQKLQPIYVQDVAQCIINTMVNTQSPGKTYTLGGPEVMSKTDLLNFVMEQTVRQDSSIVDLPEFVARVYATVVENFAPVSWRMLSVDDIDRASMDNVVPTKVLGCEDLGVKPVTMEKEGSVVLIRHRGARDAKHNQFDLPKGYGKIDAF